MRVFPLLVLLACSNASLGLDAGADGAVVAPLNSTARARAAADLRLQLETLDTGWMWSATILRDEPEEPLELPLPPQYGLARSVRLARVSLYQSVAVDVARAGAAVASEAPVIADRALRVRAYVEDGAGSLVLGRLRWESGGTTTLFVGSMHVVGPSVDTDAESLFEFEVPGELVTADARFAVDILEDGGGSFIGNSQARFPAEGGYHSAGAEEAMQIEVRVVPMRYAFDGSNRLPDISSDQVEALREHIEAVFPVSEATVSVLPPRDYAERIARDEFDDHVDALHQVIAWRASDAPPSHVYYLALVSPKDTFSAYCTGGCYAGVAPLNEINTPFQRAGLVVWYGAETSAWTALHELGHTKGRAHVPCGAVSGEDVSYPYADGSIGVWGFDQRSGEFLSPAHKDFMSYCSNEWVSDYTYAAMAERIRGLAAAPSLAVALPQRERHLITTGTRLRWSPLSPPPGVLGEAVELEAIDRRGRRRMVPAERFRYSGAGAASYALHVDADVAAYIVEGRRLEVPASMRGR